MNSTKNYTYTVDVEMDFDAIAQYYHLSKKTYLPKCENCIRNWIACDDEEYYVIDNVEEIAQDLYDYLQQCTKNYRTLDAVQKQELFKYIADKYYAKDLEHFDVASCLEAIGEFAGDCYEWIGEDEDFDTKKLAEEFYKYLQKKKQSDRKPLAKGSKNKKKGRK